MNDIYISLLYHLATRQITGIVTGVDLVDVATDNKDFDPAGRAQWLATYFMPSSHSTASKDTTGIIDTGIFQITVVTRSDVYNTNALTISSDILNGYAPNTKLVCNGGFVVISNATIASAIIENGMYQIPISINFMRI